MGKICKDSRIMAAQGEMVLLQPLPERFVIAEIETLFESHWSVTFDYVHNLHFEGIAKSQYVIGYIQKNNPFEASALKISNEYYSPFVKQGTPFQIIHTLELEALLRFYDSHHRPFVISDLESL